MDSRRGIPHPPAAGYREVQQNPVLALLQNLLSVQASEINRLVVENHQLAESIVALKQQLDAVETKIQPLKDQAQRDARIKYHLEQIQKMEARIRANENVKKDRQEAFSKAQSLVSVRDERVSQIQHATQELENAQADNKKLHEMLAELDRLREEYQVLRKTFEHEKDTNTKRVESMKILEKDVVRMAEEVERLRAEVRNAKRMAQDPNNGHCINSSTSILPPPIQAPNSHNMNPHLSFTPPMQGSFTYVTDQPGFVAAPEENVQNNSSAPGGGGGGADPGVSHN